MPDYSRLKVPPVLLIYFMFSLTVQTRSARDAEPLRLVNSGSRVPSIAAGSVVTAYGSGLADVTHAVLIVHPGSRDEVHEYDAVILQGDDEHIDLILPEVVTPIDGWARLSLRRPAKTGVTSEILSVPTFLEAVAPGIFTLGDRGEGLPAGTVTYSDIQGVQETTTFETPPRSVPGMTVTATIALTGALPPACPERPANAVRAYLQTGHGTAQVPITRFVRTVPGYQQLDVDLTDWLDSGLSRDDHARLFVRVLGCGEGPVDSNDVLLRLSQPAAFAAPRPDAWAQLADDAPLTSSKTGSKRLAAVLSYASTLNDWNARAAAVRRSILRGAGLEPLPERTPLNPIVSRLRMRTGYSVENAAFEATPGFFVTGNLFLPLHRTPPYPAILLPHGHFGEWGGYARALPESQRLAARLAEMGAVVFTYDMIGWGDSHQLDHPDSYGFLGIDDKTHFNDGSANNLLALQLWDSIRAVDFLETLRDAAGRPLVETSRIGVTGASGGATQALYLAAVDSRIRAAAFASMIAADFTGNDYCEDGMPVHFVAGEVNSNNTEIAASIAPRPLLIISDGADWTRHFPQDEYAYVKQVYSLFGADDHALNSHFANGGHDYSFSKRARAYDFFAAAFGLQRLPDLDSSAGDNREDIVLEMESTLHVFNGAFPRPAIPMTHLAAK
jgi:uncharacterized protein (TIGR03437 family)